VIAVLNSEMLEWQSTALVMHLNLSPESISAYLYVKESKTKRERGGDDD